MQQRQPHSLEKKLQAAQNLTHALHKGHICIQILWWLKAALHNPGAEWVCCWMTPNLFLPLLPSWSLPPSSAWMGRGCCSASHHKEVVLSVDKPSPSPADLPTTPPVVRTLVALWPWREIPKVQSDLGKGSSTRSRSRVSLGVPSPLVNSPWLLNAAWVTHTWMKVVLLLLFCPLQPLKSAPHQEGRWLCQARLAPALEPVPMSKSFPSGQELTIHSGNNGTLCTVLWTTGQWNSEALLPSSSVTPFGFTVSPWVVFPADSESQVSESYCQRLQ